MPGECPETIRRPLIGITRRSLPTVPRRSTVWDQCLRTVVACPRIIRRRIFTTSRGSTPATTQGSEPGFGLSLEELTPQLAARLKVPAGMSGPVITDVDPDRSAASSGARPGDVILSVNRVPVPATVDARRELRKI